jgi:hypothetical protein
VIEGDVLEKDHDDVFDRRSRRAIVGEDRHRDGAGEDRPRRQRGDMSSPRVFTAPLSRFSVTHADRTADNARSDTRIKAVLQPARHNRFARLEVETVATGSDALVR